MAFQNIYTHRKVADTSSKACEICYKPSTSVLVAPENKDFFYICPGHLKDKGFCSPIVDEAAIAAKRKKEMEAEVERFKKEFEEKQKRKKEREKAKEEKEKDKGKAKDKTDDSKQDDEEKDLGEKKKSDEGPDPPVEEEPRVFALQKAFYQQRIERKRNAEITRRNRERLQTPNLFPTVPRGLP